MKLTRRRTLQWWIWKKQWHPCVSGNWPSWLMRLLSLSFCRVTMLHVLWHHRLDLIYTVLRMTLTLAETNTWGIPVLLMKDSCYERQRCRTIESPRRHWWLLARFRAPISSQMCSSGCHSGGDWGLPLRPKRSAGRRLQKCLWNINSKICYAYGTVCYVDSAVLQFRSVNLFNLLKKHCQEPGKVPGVCIPFSWGGVLLKRFNFLGLVWHTSSMTEYSRTHVSLVKLKPDSDVAFLSTLARLVYIPLTTTTIIDTFSATTTTVLLLLLSFSSSTTSCYYYSLLLLLLLLLLLTYYYFLLQLLLVLLPLHLPLLVLLNTFTSISAYPNSIPASSSGTSTGLLLLLKL